MQNLRAGSKKLQEGKTGTRPASNLLGPKNITKQKTVTYLHLAEHGPKHVWFSFLLVDKKKNYTGIWNIFKSFCSQGHGRSVALYLAGCKVPNPRCCDPQPGVLYLWAILYSVHASLTSYTQPSFYYLYFSREQLFILMASQSFFITAKLAQRKRRISCLIEKYGR